MAISITSITGLAGPFGPASLRSTLPQTPIFTAAIVDVLDAASGSFWCYAPQDGTYVLDVQYLARRELPLVGVPETPVSKRVRLSQGKYRLDVSGTQVLASPLA